MSVSDTILSIIFTNQNQLNPLKLSLLALLDQQPAVPFEILVIDCGSTDGSDQFLTSQAEKGAIRAIFTDEGKGRTAARNHGANQAYGRHLMFMDPGMLVAPRWSDSLVRSLEKDPRLAAVSGRILLPDGRLDHTGLALLNWPATETARPRLSSRTIYAGRPANYAAADRPMMVQAVAGEALMVRATCYFAVGGFSARVGREHLLQRPDFEGDPSGVDFCLRLGSRGWSCVYQPQSIMTRLRQTDGDQAEALQNHERDMAILGRTWLDRIRPDFNITADGGGVPTENGAIKPYVEPVLNFQSGPARGIMNPEGDISKPAASVIVPTCDDLENSRRCVEALVQNTGPNHELLLLDSGNDPAMNIFLTEMARKYDQCQLVVTKGGSDCAASINQALSLCEGRHIVLLDRRVIVTVGWLETLIGTAEMNPGAGLVGPVTNRMNGMQQVPTTEYDTETREGLEAFATSQMMQHASEQTRTMRLGGFCLLIKRELLARIGGLDSRFDGGFYEYNDYSLRAHMAGYDCLIARGCFVHHQSLDLKSIVTDERMLQLEIQWEIFKRKWDVPASVSLNSQLDLGTLLVGEFNPRKHFQALGVAEKKTDDRFGVELQDAARS